MQSEEALKEILKTKFNLLKSISEVQPLKDITCSYINMKGIKCGKVCSVLEPKPRCRVHVSCLDVKQCSHMTTDAEGNIVQCNNLTRSKGSFCYYHNIMEYSRSKAKQYYHENKDKILKEKN